MGRCAMFPRPASFTFWRPTQPAAHKGRTPAIFSWGQTPLSIHAGYLADWGKLFYFSPIIPP